MLFGRKPKTVKVKLMEYASGQMVGKKDIAEDDLPETFETQATFAIGGPEWQVLEADPMLASEYRKTGEVTLMVRALPAEGPDAVYVEPTICGDLAPILPGSSKVGVRRSQLLPEDWRQVEFVSREHQAEIDENFAAIREVLANNAVENGFDRRFVRTKLPKPMGMESRFTLEELKAVFEDGVDELDGLAYLGVPGLVEGGFGFFSSSLTQYFGCVADGVVAVLCIGVVGTHEYDSPEVQAVADFANEHDLCLVEWSTATQRNPDTDEFFQFFDSGELILDETAPV